MRITTTHLDFWSQHHRPSWAGRVARPVKRVSIDACVNDHAPPPSRDQKHEMSNLLHVLGMIRRRGGNLRAELYRMGWYPYPGYSARRIANCRNIYRKLTKTSK